MNWNDETQKSMYYYYYHYFETKKKEKILNQPYTNIYNNSIIITLYKTLLAPYITRTSVCLIFVFEKISTTKTIPTKKKVPSYSSAPWISFKPSRSI